MLDAYVCNINVKYSIKSTFFQIGIDGDILVGAMRMTVLQQHHCHLIHEHDNDGDDDEPITK